MVCVGQGYFGDVVCQLEALGLLDVLLPFLLIFTIAFAVLQKSKILGEHSHRFNVIVSFVLGAAAVIPHVTGTYPPGMDAVDIINRALPNVSLLMIASMMALLLIGVFGNDVNVAGTSLAGIVVIFSFLAVGYTFLSSAGLVRRIWLFDENTRNLLVAILIFGLIVWFITSEPGQKDKDEGIGKFFEGLGKVYGGGKHGGH